ncbi:MAG: hypothetical protein QXL51_07285 [Candidatus Aenigmatarchaeota archaeon]
MAKSKKLDKVLINTIPKESLKAEYERLNTIKVDVPEIIINNFMTWKERKWFIIGQKLEFQILTGIKLKKYTLKTDNNLKH